MLHRITARISKFLLKKEFVQNSLKEDLDLSFLRKRPTARVIVGISLVLFSYALGWPIVGILGIISLYVGKPLVLIVGGPLTYGLAHLVFLVGMYIAGKEYVTVLFKWSLKVAFEKFFGVHQKSTVSPLDTENQG